MSILSRERNAESGVFGGFLERRPLFYYITDRRALTVPDEAALLRRVRKIIARGIDFIQIREKDLPDRRLFDLTCRIVRVAHEIPHGSRCRVLVNGRADIAVAAGADGVHLPSYSMGIAAICTWIPKNFIVGISVHTMREINSACACGADYILLGHVFPTVSKESMGAALGVDFLQRACLGASVPVLALGGITEERIPAVLQAGAAGVAGITLFQKDDRQPPKTTNSALRALDTKPHELPG
jgi:thiamine-phosphate pyrophosphorylase